MLCSLVYFISAVASPICGFGIDQLGRNIFWLLMGVIITLVCHGVLAFTFLTPFVPMVYNYYMVSAYIHLLPFSPTAIAYSIGQIIKSVCVCQCVSVCVHLWAISRSHFLSIFTKIGTDVRTPQSKNEFVRGQYRTISSPILPSKTSILGQEVLKTHANIK